MDYKIKLITIKIAVVGDSIVGKSALLNSYISGEPKLDANTIIGDRLNIKFKLKNGKEIKLVLIDTAGQERFRSSVLRYQRSCHGVILIYSLTNKRSFENIKDWMRFLEDEGIKAYAIFGNKSDMIDNRIINSEEARCMAEKLGLAYFETYCKTREGIEEGFTFVANEIYEKLESKRNNNINLEDKKMEKDSNSNCAGKKKNKKQKRINKI